MRLKVNLVDGKEQNTGGGEVESVHDVEAVDKLRSNQLRKSGLDLEMI